MGSSIKDYYCAKNIKCCLTCRFIDLEMFNVNGPDEEIKLHDGMAWCNNKKKAISPMWGTNCNEYERD